MVQEEFKRMEEWCLDMPSPMETNKVSKEMINETATRCLDTPGQDEPNAGIRQTGNKKEGDNPNSQGMHHGQRPMGRSRHQHDVLCLCRTGPRGRDPTEVINREQNGMDPPPRIQPNTGG